MWFKFIVSFISNQSYVLYGWMQFQLVGFMPTLYLVIEKIYSAYEGHFFQDLLYVAHFMFYMSMEFQLILVVNGGDVESHSYKYV